MTECQACNDFTTGELCPTDTCEWKNNACLFKVTRICLEWSYACPIGRYKHTTRACAGDECTIEDDAQACCIESMLAHTHIEFQGETNRDDPTPQYDFMELFRPSFVKFKKCTRTECEDCNSDNECGWKRLWFNELDTVGSETHVAEFWADCAEHANARWKVQAQPVGVDTEAFANANTTVYLAQEGGHMQGKRHELDDPNMKVGTGSTRLYVVIKAKNEAQRIKVGIQVKIEDATAAVGDCMDNKMCLSTINSTDAGSTLRNNNTVQLHCLTNQTSDFSALLNATCQVWKDCLDAHEVDRDLLLAILQAGQTSSSALFAERELTLDSNGSESTGGCAHPAHDDPESWECECSQVLLDACANRTHELAACITEEMCASNEVCLSWKQQKPCPGILLSKDDVSIQADVSAIRDVARGRKQPPGNITSFEPEQLEESLSGKAGSTTCR